MSTFTPGMMPSLFGGLRAANFDAIQNRTDSTPQRMGAPIEAFQQAVGGQATPPLQEGGIASLAQSIMDRANNRTEADPWGFFNPATRQGEQRTFDPATGQATSQFQGGVGAIANMIAQKQGGLGTQMTPAQQFTPEQLQPLPQLSPLMGGMFGQMPQQSTGNTGLFGQAPQIPQGTSYGNENRQLKTLGA